MSNPQFSDPQFSASGVSTSRVSAQSPQQRSLRQRILDSPRVALSIRSAVVIAIVIAVLYVVEAIDAATDYELNRDGVIPRQTDGLAGIVYSPFLHANFSHLASNAVPAAIFGFLLLMARRFWITTLIVWIFSGVGVWLFGSSHTVTIGASGIVFGWLGFLLLRGLFNRSPMQIGLGVLLLLTYGSVLWGALPISSHISWQAHLCGFIGGAAAAALLARRDRRSPASDSATTAELPS